jgi:hypothetical protein
MHPKLSIVAEFRSESVAEGEPELVAVLGRMRKQGGVKLLKLILTKKEATHCWVASFNF